MEVTLALAITNRVWTTHMRANTCEVVVGKNDAFFMQNCKSKRHSLRGHIGIILLATFLD